MTPAIIGGATALLGIKASSDAASAQAAASKAQLELQSRIYDETVERFQPYYDKGTNALSGLSYELGLQKKKPKGYQPLEMSPSGEFLMDEGFNQLSQQAGVGGTLRSGPTLKAFEEYRQGLASQDHQRQLGNLLAMTGIGADAARGGASAGANYAMGGANALANYGDARAAGSVGMFNALANGINTGFQVHEMMPAAPTHNNGLRYTKTDYAGPMARP